MTDTTGLDKKKTRSRRKATMEQKSNRQVNYSIIRLLWNKYRKKQNLYYFIGIPKNRYASIINGTYSMPLEAESKKLEKSWGVDASVFNGDLLVTTEGIEREAWDEYFINQDDMETERVKEFEERFHNVTQIESFMSKRNADINLWKLYRFIRFNEIFTGTILEVKMDNAIDTLDEVMSSALFEGIEITKLEKYIDTLELSLRKAKIIYDYRDIKRKEDF